MDINRMGYEDLKDLLRCSSVNVCLPDELLERACEALFGGEEKSEHVRRLEAEFPDWVE